MFLVFLISVQFRIPCAGISYVKLQRHLQILIKRKGFVVERNQLIVNEYQILVDGCFLNFQIISVRKFRNNKIYISLIGFREREFNCTIFNITDCISCMYSGNIIAVYDITIVNSDKRRSQYAFKMFQSFESSNNLPVT